jgi:hypothetical protein
MVEITSGFGFGIVGNRGRAVVLDGAGEDGSERDERKDGGKRETGKKMQSDSVSMRR